MDKKDDTERINIHKEICNEMTSLYARKNHDYGSSFKCTRDRVPNAILVRLYDKVNRLCSLYEDPENIRVPGENVEDTLIDLADYAVMELVEIRMDRKQQTCATGAKDAQSFETNASEGILCVVEQVLGIHLYAWQRDFILGISDYVCPDRQSGKTTAYMLRLLFSPGDPISMYDKNVLRALCDENYGECYRRYFVRNLHGMYEQLRSNPVLRPLVRPIVFQKPEIPG